MQTRFFDTASIDYPIIDSDAHVNEPPNLWQDRVPAKWKERAPRVLETERGDIWSFDGGREKWPMGLTATELFDVTSLSTMSLDVADINHDGLLDFFVSNISAEYALLESHFMFVSSGDLGSKPTPRGR